MKLEEDKNERFKKRSLSIHGDIFDLSKINYVNRETKVDLTCKKCKKSFKQKPSIHLMGSGCPYCSKIEQYDKIKVSYDEFKERAENKHKDEQGNPLYDYSKSIINGVHNKTIIICKRCGREFEQIVNNHLNGRGCSYCNKKNIKYCRKNTYCNTEKYIKKAIKVHGNDYDYSSVNYINNHTKIIIKCNKCGLIFNQSPSSHLADHGCPKCCRRKHYKIKMNLQEFIEKSELIHKDKRGNPMFDYSKSTYNGSLSKTIITCKKCGRDFEQRTSHHLEGCGCPYCRKSDGEKKIEKLLFINNIKYDPQHSFKDCRCKLPLPFDFYLPDYNICVEYDGIHHFEKRLGMGGFDRFVNQQLNDKIKNDYCSNKNIILFRIKYTDNIDIKFNDILDFIKK